jgi:hypothetical protein
MFVVALKRAGFAGSRSRTALWKIPTRRKVHSYSSNQLFLFIMDCTYCTLSLLHVYVILIISYYVIFFHVLAQDQAVFSRDVDLSLKKNQLYPKNIEDFIAGFEKHCSENSKLKKVLTHTKVYNMSHIRLNSFQFFVSYV